MRSPRAGSRTTPFGARLRLLRRARGLSQLALAIRAGTPSRHVSFLETGRSRPSVEMVLRLGRALDASLRQQNELLVAAGLAPGYAEEPFEGASLEPFRAALERLLVAHEPYPAVVVDRLWNVVAANGASGALFGPDVVGANLVRRYVEDHEAIENWPEVAAAARSRLRLQLREAPADEALVELVELVEAEMAELPDATSLDTELVACPRFRMGDTVIRTAVLAARFDHPLEVTLAELRVELVYPLDEPSAQFFREAAARPTA